LYCCQPILHAEKDKGEAQSFGGEACGPVSFQKANNKKTEATERRFEKKKEESGKPVRPF
jgi:hypothetical protein